MKLHTLKTMITIQNLETFETTFKNYRYFNILSTLWNIYSNIIDIDSKTKLSNKEFVEEPIWYLFYKLYILNRNVRVEVTKSFLEQLRDYSVVVLEKYTKTSVDNINITFKNNSAILEKKLDLKLLFKILIDDECL